MAEHQPIVRVRTRREDCHLVYADRDVEVWFDPDRRVAGGKYGGPSIFLVEVKQGNTIVEHWRADLFGASGLHDHWHDNPEDLNDPDHDWHLDEGENAFEVALGYLQSPSSLARLLDATGHSSFAEILPLRYPGLRDAAKDIRIIMNMHEREKRDAAN